MPDNISHIAVTATPIIRSTLERVPGGPSLLALARFHYAPRATFGPAAGPGPVVFHVEAGRLIFSAKGQVVLHRANGSGAEYPAEDTEFTISEGDQLLVPGDVVHRVYNQGPSPATILGAATFPEGPPPKNFPEGVTFQPLVLNMVEAPVSAPADYSLNRVSYAPGTEDAGAFAAGPGLKYVETGGITIRAIQGQLTVLRQPGAPGGETIGPGREVKVSAGQGVYIAPNAVVTTSNTSRSPAAVLELKTSSSIRPGNEGSKADKNILPRFTSTVMDRGNPERVRDFLAPTFFSHDQPPGGARLGLNKEGLEGVERFLGKLIFPAFSSFKTKFNELIAQDDLVAGYWTQTFRHTGDGYLGLKATNKAVTIEGLTIVRVQNGKMVEQWEVRDILGWHKQIGIPVQLGRLEGGAAQDRHKDVVRDFFRSWNDGDIAGFDKVLAGDFKNHHLLDAQREGRNGMRQLASTLRSALPDLQVTIDVIVSDDEGKVFVRSRYSGTHERSLFGVAGSGKPIEVAAIDLFRVHDGKIKERWGMIDMLSLGIQLGAIKPPQLPDDGG